MRGGSRIPALVTFALAAATSASAQVHSAPEAQRVQIGASLDGLVIISPEGGGALPIANVRVTAPVGSRFALEGFVSVPRREYDSYFGLYGFQVKQRLATEPTSSRRMASWEGTITRLHTTTSTRLTTENRTSSTSRRIPR